MARSFRTRRCSLRKTVRRLLADEELAVVIASRDRHIIGCGIGFPRAWNQSLEIGTLSVDAVSSRAKIGKALFEAMRRLGFKSYGVVYFRASSEKSFRRARKIGATAWGFRPAPGSSDLKNSEFCWASSTRTDRHNACSPPKTSSPSDHLLAHRRGSAKRRPRFPVPQELPRRQPAGHRHAGDFGARLADLSLPR